MKRNVALRRKAEKKARKAAKKAAREAEGRSKPAKRRTERRDVKVKTVEDRLCWKLVGLALVASAVFLALALATFDWESVWMLAADGSLLAYTVRKWRFYLDPCVPDVALAFDKERLTAIADGLGVPVKRLLQGYIRTDGNIPYRLVCSVADELGVSVKELHDANANTDTPQGAGGLEWAFDKPLAGTNGAYDASLRLDERVKRVTPVPGGTSARPSSPTSRESCGASSPPLAGRTARSRRLRS